MSGMVSPTDPTEQLSDQVGAVVNEAENGLALRLWRHWEALRGEQALPSMRHFSADVLSGFADRALVMDIKRAGDIKRTGDIKGVGQEIAFQFIGELLLDRPAKEILDVPISQLPQESLLAAVAKHCAEAIADLAPVGFSESYDDGNGELEAILLPFSENGQTPDALIGVVTKDKKLSQTTSEAAEETDAGEDELELVDVIESETEEAAETAPPPFDTQGLELPGPSDDEADISIDEVELDDAVVSDTGEHADLNAADPNASADPDADVDLDESEDLETSTGHLAQDEEQDAEMAPPASAATASNDVGPELAQLRSELFDCRRQALIYEETGLKARSALYRTLAQAYGFYFTTLDQPAAFTALCAQMGIKVQKRAPFTPIVKLVFGANFHKGRLSEYAGCLAHAHAMGQTPESFRAFVEAQEGGIKGCAEAARAKRRGLPDPTVLEGAYESLRAKPVLGRVQDPSGGGKAEFVLMIARRSPSEQGALDLLELVEEPPKRLEAIVKRLADKGHD